MKTVFMLSAFFLSLSLIIAWHELGHFLPAKLFKVRVTKFYLFFDFLFPLSNVANFSLFKYKRKAKENENPDDITQYGLGWFPFGGYVQIAGMVDETQTEDQLASEPQDWEYRSKSVPKRLLIISGGVLMNLLLAIMIYVAMAWVYGKSYTKTDSLQYGLYASETGKQIGFQNGDKLISINGQAVPHFEDINRILMLEEVNEIIVQRNATTISLHPTVDYKQEALKNKEMQLVGIAFPAIVKNILPNSNAEKGGLLAGDKIVKINNDSTTYFFDFQRKLQANAGKEASIAVNRNNSIQNLKVQVTPEGTIGFQPETENFSQIVEIKLELGDAITEGFARTFSTLVGYVKQFKLVFTKEGAKQVGGFASIAKQFEPPTNKDNEPVWSWEKFWSITAFLSLAIGFMNILPIPALDGGYIVFLLYEGITGRPPSIKFQNIALNIGFAMVIALLLFSNGNDIFRSFMK